MTDPDYFLAGLDGNPAVNVLPLPQPHLCPCNPSHRVELDYGYAPLEVTTRADGRGVDVEVSAASCWTRCLDCCPGGLNFL